MLPVNFRLSLGSFHAKSTSGSPDDHLRFPYFWHTYRPISDEMKYKILALNTNPFQNNATLYERGVTRYRWPS